MSTHLCSPAVVVLVWAAVLLPSRQAALQAADASPAASTRPAPAAVPSPMDQSAADKLIKSIFVTEYAVKTPAGRQQLAGKLLAQAAQSQDDPAARYVLLREARDLWAMTGDVPSALIAIDALAEGFAVNGDDLRIETFRIATTSGPAGAKASAEAAIALAEQAMRSDRVEAVGRLAIAAEQAARAGKDATLMKSIGDRAAALRRAEAEAKAAADARVRLATNPDDPTSNGILGKYVAVARGDWPRALPMLAKGSDPNWKSIATRELAAAPPAEIADAWWTFADQQPEPAKSAIRRHAADIYRSALPTLGGLTKALAERRVAEYPAAAAAASGASTTPGVTPPPVKPGTRRPFRSGSGTLFANGDDRFELALNGKVIAQGGHDVVQTAVTVSVGDVILVKLTNAKYEKGFCAAVRLEDGRHLITHRQTWRSYTPKNADDWTNPTGVTDVKACGRGHDNYLFTKFNHAFSAGQETLWSASLADQSAYLFHKVTEDSVVDPQAAIAPARSAKRHKGTLYANGDDTFVLHINGQRVCHGTTEVVEVPVEIGVGDVITVKGTNSTYEKGFACVIKLESGKVVISDRASWKSYAPRNELLWFAPSEVVNVKPAGIGEMDYLREKFDKVLPVDRDALWTSDKDSRGVSYLALGITEDSLVTPRPAPAKAK